MTVFRRETSWRSCHRSPVADPMYLSTDPIELTPLLAEVTAPAYGGVACFLGTVRDHHSGRQVVRLEYSAYARMAEAECSRIVREARAQWDCSVALRHRIGTLGIGETAVAIVVAAAHRDAAFAACRFVIEEVKQRVPIWKRELFADGTVEWVGASAEAGKTGSREGTALKSGKVGRPASQETHGAIEIRAHHTEGSRG
jgi:molybdopterin synthase catalytic subunit